MNSFSLLEVGAADRQAVGVGQQQPHGLYVAGVAQFAEFLGEPTTINRLPENRAQFFTRARAPPRIATAASLPGRFG
jgi:hypothetical protein